MKILAIYRHYWPDATPYARILRLLCEHWARVGHEVTVYTAQPSYNDQRLPREPWRQDLDGVHVRRIGLLTERKTSPLRRAVNHLLFVGRALAHATRGQRYDLLVANGHPPIAMGVALGLLRRLTGARSVLHLQDIHPEGVAAIGGLRSRWLRRTLVAIDAWSCRAASSVVTLSGDMTSTLSARGGRRPNVRLIANPALAATTIAPATAPLGDPPRLLFAGNLGRFQALPQLVAAVNGLPRDVPCELRLMGAGLLRESLAALARPDRVRMLPAGPVEAAIAEMQASDYGVVSLAAGVIRTATPSKTATYLAAGRPVIALIEPDSELARTICVNRLGYVARSLSPTDIVATIRRALAERDRWTTAECRRLQTFAHEHWGVGRMLSQWDNLLAELGLDAARVRPQRQEAA